MSYTLTVVLGGVVVATMGSFIGHYIGSRNKVTERNCSERRSMNDKLISEKLKRIDDNMDHVLKVVKEIREDVKEKFDLITRN